MSLQKKLTFAVKGENFLKFKLEQIIFEIKKNWDNYLKQREIFLKLYKETMIKLNQTYKEMGKRELNSISKLSKIQYNPMITINYIKKIGTLVPIIDYELIREESLPAYSFENTSHYLDDLIILLIKFFENLIIFSQSEDLLLKLSLTFKKINRRINGLKNVIIPELQIDIKKIKAVLEEIERENYVRLKNTKNIITKNA
jgi:V/A-type H+-transporting ATPase subunit D